MPERVPCANPDCRNTILPATAAVNGGLCAPCVAAIRKKEYKEYVRLNRRTVNLYEGVNDPVEIALIMLSRRKYDPLIVYAPAPVTCEGLVGAFTEVEAVRLAEAAAKALKEGNVDLAEDIAKTLATLTDFDLTEILRMWVAADHHSPSIAFREAKPEIRDAIIQSLNSGRANADHALSALAWIGDDVVQKTFLKWDSEMPAWTSSLYISPSAYGRVAGWQMVGKTRRNLFHEECLAITQATQGQAADAVNVFQKTEQTCPWCGNSLFHMLDLDLSDPRFAFLNFTGLRLPVLTCHVCTCYGRGFFSKIDSAGKAIPHPLGVRPEWLPETSVDWGMPAWKDLPIRLKPRRAIHAADWCMELKTSQIGGHPCWVQDSEYPQCPQCSTTMRFIAQLNQDDLPGQEGTYYAFLCPPCRTTSTTYQQT